MLNCPRRTIGWSSCPVIRSRRRTCCSCFDSRRSNFLLNRRQKSKPGTIAKSRERSSPVVPTFGAASQGFQHLGVTQHPTPSVGEVGLTRPRLPLCAPPSPRPAPRGNASVEGDHH